MKESAEQAKHISFLTSALAKVVKQTKPESADPSQAVREMMDAKVTVLGMSSALCSPHRGTILKAEARGAGGIRSMRATCLGPLHVGPWLACQTHVQRVRSSDTVSTHSKCHLPTELYTM